LLLTNFHDEQRIYLLLEYAPDEELYRRMQTEKTLCESEAAEYVYQLSYTLNYLHTKRVIHQDMFGEFDEYENYKLICCRY
ncbi:unnamed protein product, partial [Rotaria sp. Silwood2]